MEQTNQRDYDVTYIKIVENEHDIKKYNTTLSSKNKSKAGKIRRYNDRKNMFSRIEYFKATKKITDRYRGIASNVKH